MTLAPRNAKPSAAARPMPVSNMPPTFAPAPAATHSSCASLAMARPPRRDGLMQAMSMLASTGIAGMGGMRTQIVNGRRTIYMKDDGAFTSMVGDRIMVRVEGKGLPEETLKQFLTAVDFVAVEKAGK